MTKTTEATDKDEFAGKRIKISAEHKRNVMILGALIFPCEHHTKYQWECLLEICAFKCQKCGSTHDITKDHIIPKKLGGNDTIKNIQPLCRSCNSSKKTNTINYISESALRYLDNGGEAIMKEVEDAEKVY